MDEDELAGEGTTLEDAIAAFEKNLGDDGFLKETDEEETTEEVSEEDEETEEEGDSEDTSEGEEEEEESSDTTTTADDEAEVEVSVNGVNTKFKVKDLKRLAGQEAALTQRSQAIAGRVREVELRGQASAMVLQKQLDKAKARFKQYENVDLFKASRELEPEEFDALRKDMEAAKADVDFIETEAAQFIKDINASRQAELKEQAKASLPVIIKAIPEWNAQLYHDVRTYAVSQGMDRDVVNELVDPSAIILIHKAFQYDKAKAAVKTKVKEQLAKAPKKNVTPTNSTQKSSAGKAKQLLAKAKLSGDIDDIAAALAASAE